MIGKRSHEFCVFVADAPAHLARHVAARTHAGRVPWVHFRVPPGEPIGVLGHRPRELRAVAAGSSCQFLLPTGYCFDIQSAQLCR